jgi:hypothetical protein
MQRDLIAPAENPVVCLETAAGSVTGRNHMQIGRNNQDAVLVHTSPGRTFLVVADGCSDGAQSEVGAWQGAWMAVQALDLCGVASRPWCDDLFSEVKWRLVERLRNLANGLGGDVVRRFLLFTLVGAVVVPDRGAIGFAFGDGLVALNGAVTRFETPRGVGGRQEPAYIGYCLGRATGPHDLRFRLTTEVPWDLFDSALVATDGAMEVDEVAGRMLPGEETLLGPLSQFWQDDRYFDEPDALRAHLFLANRPYFGLDRTTRRPVRKLGLLSDDTTIAVARRARPRVPFRNPWLPDEPADALRASRSEPPTSPQEPPPTSPPPAPPSSPPSPPEQGA